MLSITKVPILGDRLTFSLFFLFSSSFVYHPLILFNATSSYTIFSRPLASHTLVSILHLTVVVTLPPSLDRRAVILLCYLFF